MKERVRIAGAGLGGLFAALRLARAGLDVEVLEIKSRIAPSSGPHSEAVRNYVREDAFVELRRHGFDFKPFGRVETTIRRSVNFQNILRGPAYYLYARGREPYTLDYNLYTQCQDAGVRFTFQARDRSNLPVDIVATGPPPDRVNIVGVGLTFSAEGSELDQHTAYALLDNRVAPGGYFVITPGIDYHSAYSVSWGELQYERLVQMAESASRLPWVAQILGSSKRLDRIYGRAYFSPNPIATAERNGVLYVGEAGGFQDAVAGFGFRYAVLTAALAADSIAQGVSYRRLLDKAFGNEFASGYALRRRLNHFSNDDLDKLVGSMGPEMTVDDYRQQRAIRFL